MVHIHSAKSKQGNGTNDLVSQQSARRKQERVINQLQQTSLESSFKHSGKESFKNNHMNLNTDLIFGDAKKLLLIFKGALMVLRVFFFWIFF